MKIYLYDARWRGCVTIVAHNREEADQLIQETEWWKQCLEWWKDSQHLPPISILEKEIKTGVIHIAPGDC